jgi:integrase
MTALPAKSLTAAFVSSVTSPGKYHDGKGAGLFLLVKGTGAKSWVQRITVRNRRRDIGLGAPPFVTLAEARQKAIENRRVALGGGDPLALKRKARAMLTFEEAAHKAHAEIAPTLANPKDRDAFLSSLRSYLFPRFGASSVADVTSADIRQAILAAREKAPGVARKLTYRTSQVFRWAMAEGLCTANPATPEALALPRQTAEPDRRKALPYAAVAGCLSAAWDSDAGLSTKLALEFLVLTAGRSGEVRGADWSEIDMAAKVWEIPATRMKMKRPHRLPLSPRAMVLLEQAKALGNGAGLVFPGTKAGRPLSDMTVSKLVKELGFEADVHGFRTSFRMWAQERTNTPREVAEAALAHITGNAVEQAYARSDFFEKRRKLMEGWAGFLEGRAANIHPFIRVQ